MEYHNGPLPVNPLISICIPAYNAGKYIHEAITCWQRQTYKNIEIIIQDDCSKDDTFQIAQLLAIKDTRIKVFRNIANLGIGENWNEVYRKADGDFVVIANADDIYELEMIENALKIFNSNKNLNAVTFKFLLYYELNGQRQKIQIHNDLKVGLQNSLFQLCFFKNPFSIVFTVFKKEQLDKILLENGMLFLKTQICDAELFFRAGLNGFNLYFSDYIGGSYRKHESNNSSKKNGERYSWLFDVFPLYRQHLLNHYQKETKDLLLSRIVHHLKYQTKHFKLPDLKQLNRFLREYYTFKNHKKA